MFKRLANFFHPFSVIAKELTIIRQLYEQELAERSLVLGPKDEVRPAPIIRITEKPKKTDTEISYMGDDSRPKSALQKAKEAFDRLGEDDDD